ncbi:hypothetical protein QBC46DRAFT_65672 [Diplogelasinospora grovesii]|uniref:Uncharacterized protein n=1 Tax=Diplogelasinospora grovesii TaxID=303347 RepID=A0AAN6S6Y3_9PEZI|nr:hypothetical protein QBC46DRAFT_65672 [Diplogelasinospora grovesii]
MAGLIPLMLGSNRTSFISQQLPSPTRQSSRSPAPVSIPSPAPSPEPTSILKPTKRLSQPPPISLPVLPYSRADWKRTISEIKRQHVSRRYRACSARCSEILDNIKDTTQVEPVYLIYLHFYAATSMELCARPLPQTSPYRRSLLQQARTHFDRAASLINAAEDSVVRKTRSFSVCSSRSSSCHSASSSISSQAWTVDTRMSSPTSSIYSYEDLAAKSQPAPVTPEPKRVKKVSFSLPPSEPVFRTPEPIIRPDSPTLGFDDEYFQAGAARSALPALPKPKVQEIEIPLPRSVSSLSCLSLSRFDSPTPSEIDRDPSVVPRSVHRYFKHLEGLRTQLESHSASLDELLNTRRSLLLTAEDMLAQTKARTSTTEGEALRALDRQARIQRLRKTGWQRPRFDARRYEELCYAVMQELS